MEFPAEETDGMMDERMRYVEKWAQYVVSHDDWSRLQKELIDSR